jgi:hypothetical protein
MQRDAKAHATTRLEAVPDANEIQRKSESATGLGYHRVRSSMTSQPWRRWNHVATQGMAFQRPESSFQFSASGKSDVSVIHEKIVPQVYTLSNENLALKIVWGRKWRQSTATVIIQNSVNK